MTKDNDARKPLEELFDTADAVLCDVPCSGLGIIAKKPDIRYKGREEIERLPEIQREILTQSAKYVKCGGILVYSTCTVFREENEDNVQKFLEAHPEFSLVPFSVGDIHARTGMLTLLPHIHNTDGFFIAKLQRKDIP
jgi:16S rRNA (cytosine967-C5)-methyltransferase